MSTLRKYKRFWFVWGSSALMLLFVWLSKKDVAPLVLGLYVLCYGIIYVKPLTILLGRILKMTPQMSVLEFLPSFIIFTALWMGGLISFYLKIGIDQLFYLGFLMPIGWAAVIVMVAKFKRQGIYTDGTRLFLG